MSDTKVSLYHCRVIGAELATVTAIGIVVEHKVSRPSFALVIRHIVTWIGSCLVK
jgi:hypothetical protein